MSEGEAKAIFDKCAGDDGSLSLKEALDCAKESGHGKHAKGMKKHWPKDAEGKPIEITWADAKKAWEEHNSKLAQGEDMTEAEAKDIFDKCAGSDGSLSLKEAMDCAKESGHGKHAGAMKKHWPKDASGKPIEVTWDDVKKAWEEHNSLAQKGDDMEDPKAIFDFCAGDDGILEMHEAQKCAASHVSDMIGKHWPRDDNGKPAKATFDDVKKWMEKQGE